MPRAGQKASAWGEGGKERGAARPGLQGRQGERRALPQHEVARGGEEVHVGLALLYRHHPAPVPLPIRVPEPAYHACLHVIHGLISTAKTTTRSPTSLTGWSAQKKGTMRLASNSQSFRKPENSSGIGSDIVRGLHVCAP